jgi:endo-1,4-beta-xylanase
MEEPSHAFPFRNLIQGNAMTRAIRLLPRLLLCAAAVPLACAADPPFVGNILQGTAKSMTADATFTTYWKQFSPENSGKWGVVEPTRDAMQWTGFDQMMAFAATNKLITKGHTLIWYSQAPTWITTLSTADQLAEVIEWVDGFAARYPQLQYLDVVNEPIHGTPTYAAALGGAGASGWDWVRWAFTRARAKMPNTTLVLNDYEVENSQNQGLRFLQIARLLQDDGTLDMLGFQGHFLEGSDVRQVQAMLITMQSLGLPLSISELDLNFADDAAQLARYKALWPVLYRHPAMRGITLWGYKQGTMWRADAYLRRSDGSERPALTWLKSYIAGTATGLDTTAPSVPANLTVSTSATHHTLSWTAATDNVQVGAYAIYRNGVLIAGVPGNVTVYEDRGSWTDRVGYHMGATVSYRIEALDAAYNRTTSATVTATGVAAAAYQQDANGLLAIEAESAPALAAGNGTTFGFNSYTVNGTAWQALDDTAAVGGKGLAANATSGINARGWQQGPFFVLPITSTRSGPHWAWLRVRTTGGTWADDDVLLALDKVPRHLWTTGATTTWAWKKCPLPINVPSTGYHELQVYMGEDGLVIDRVVLTSDAAYTPTGNGPAASPLASTPPVIASITADPASVTGTSTQLHASVSGATSLAWSLAQQPAGSAPQIGTGTDPVVQFDRAGTYVFTLTATAADGSTAVSAVSVAVLAQPTTLTVDP